MLYENNTLLDNEMESYLRFLNYENNLSIKQIANKMMCSRSTISRLFKKYNIKTKKHDSNNHIKCDKYGFKNLECLVKFLIECHYRHKLTQQEIAEKLGCTRHTVMSLMKRFGLKAIRFQNKLHYKCGFYSENEFVKEINHLYCDLNLSASKIAKKYQVGDDSVRWVIQKYKITKNNTTNLKPTSDKKTKQFISIATEIHNNKYDYTKVHYKNNRTKVEIICPDHGSFWQVPYSHQKGHGCPKCSLKPLGLDKFIEKANNIHNNKYDYSKIKEYKNTRTKVEVICPIHGSFYITPFSHLQKHGCNKCNSTKPKTKSSFIQESNSIHNYKYDYSKVKYKNNKTNVTIICNKHGEFKQRPADHLKGNGCAKCIFENNSLKLRSNTKEFIKKSIAVHGDVYSYDKVKYIDKLTKVTITCKKHGDFEQSPNNHTRGSGCPICNESHGENIIRKFLDDNNIEYKSQNKFKNCNYIFPLRFDFYIKSYNIAIEYDGEQHFRPVNRFGGVKVFEETQKRDLIKNKFCLENGIKLIRISYKQKNKINEILNKELLKN